MIVCEYCRGTLEEGSVKCKNCGAPVDVYKASGPDFRFCPFCSRKLLSLSSPACNFCGKRLPDSYLKLRETTLRRIEETSGESAKPNSKAFSEALTAASKRRDDDDYPTVREILDFFTS